MNPAGAPLDDALRIRQADADLLSLALIDARNLTLRWLAVFESRGLDDKTGSTAPPRWWLGQAAWYQEYWIARHVQRQRGAGCDARSVRLPSLEAHADACFSQPPVDATLPDADSVRAYAAATMETTLDLLGHASPDDDGLHFFRAALLHEDRIGERLAEIAAMAKVSERPEPPPPWQPPPVRAERPPLWMPACTATIGSQPGGLVPDNERGAHTVAVPEFEIDAQAVNWARYVEFAEDDGYDRREFWSDAGWAWAQALERRAPRDVEQLRGAVLVQRQGALQRVPANQAVLHVSRFEAEAWCRWAGRRLPTEPEWELAACSAASRGFVWGDVFEWVAASARAWPGGGTDSPGSLDRLPPPGRQGVLRGASWLTPGRRHHPRARRFADPAADAMFCGFRSCAL